MPPDVNDNNAWKVIVVTTICLLTSLTMVCLRFYVRRIIIRSLGIDDWFLAASLLSYIGCALTTSVSIKFGLGRHSSTISLQEQSTFLKLMWIASTGYGTVIMLLKSTFLLQYRRVFPLSNVQRLCDAFIVFIITWAVGGTIGSLISCRPLKQNWDPVIYKDCKARLYFWYSMGVLHVLTDVAIFALPLPLLKTLSLPKLQKGVLIGVFSLGFFTCAISIIRLTTLKASTSSDDLTWNMWKTVVWSVAELACAIICVCIPTLRPLLPRFTGWQQHVNNNLNELPITPRTGEALHGNR